MLVVSASFSARRKLPGRNGRKPHLTLLPALPLSAVSTKVLLTPTNLARLAEADVMLLTKLAILPMCISPLIYEVFWHYLRLFFHF